MGRRYKSVDDLLDDMNQSSILDDESEFEGLDEDDLALLQIPQPPAQKSKRGRKPKAK